VATRPRAEYASWDGRIGPVLAAVVNAVEVVGELPVTVRMGRVVVDLEPSSFECPTHQVDVTELVREVLAEEGPPVAYRAPGRLFGRRPERMFEVIVDCPGDGPESVHSVTCAGAYR